MTRREPATRDIAGDPFAEHATREFSWRTRVLGAPCVFSSNNRVLLGIAQDAFARVPQHRWSRGAGRKLSVRLEFARDDATPAAKLPPRPVLSSGAGLLCAHLDAHSFVIIDPGAARALIRVGNSLLRHRRLVRYELIEFAVLTLASRTQGLVPLHAGCVGAGGRGVLLLGAGGSGKSTLALHAALAGLDFLAEDSVFVQPATLRATGLSAFVHARESSLALIDDRRVRNSMHRAPRIERRSGVRKHEIDLRRGLAVLAPRPLRIVATLVLRARRARGAPSLVRLTTAQLKRALRTEQPYALGQPGWPEFERRMLRAGGHRLDRTRPAEAVAALRALLAQYAARARWGAD